MLIFTLLILEFISPMKILLIKQKELQHSLLQQLELVKNGIKMDMELMLPPPVVELLMELLKMLIYWQLKYSVITEVEVTLELSVELILLHNNTTGPKTKNQLPICLLEDLSLLFLMPQ